ncbi:MAG: glycerol-3-phosphate dehydrogenase/oxidase [Acidobacteriota bacterium]|nr:glycerol-3-phosphate dehydrogenase/oxidase [Acidobacteriota bacterium]
MDASVNRESILRKIGTEQTEWDVLVIGGGATGLGCAVDAAARGYRTILFEARDFANGTSSRSTKLVHGGVRYLRQGNLKLVLEALQERGRMLRNAPHLAHRRAFVIPAYSAFDAPFYGIGLTLYDLLAGRESIGHPRILSASSVHQELPTARQTGLKGGILYYDGQFDDARYAVALFRTLLNLGGLAVNYARIIALQKRDGKIVGVEAEDDESGERFQVRAKVVINATGIFVDELRHMDSPEAPGVLTVSQGSHLVLPRSFLPGDSALMIPRTSDGRVLFAIPWHDRVVVGTTDVPVPQPDIEPQAKSDERSFLLENIERFLGRKPEPAEVLSMWSGQRPLVRHKGSGSTAAISRDHTILISDAGLVTVTGGKWTTYRRMAEDTIDKAAELAGLKRAACRTQDLHLHGWTKTFDATVTWEKVYGTDLCSIRALSADNPELAAPLHPNLPIKKTEIVWAARYEMARTVEDVLARRTRALFLDARASIEAATETARLLAVELGRDDAWQEAQVRKFQRLARQYVWT